MNTLVFNAGTLIFDGGSPPDFLGKWLLPDPRGKVFRARACDYSNIVISAREHDFPLNDLVKAFFPEHFALARPLAPRPHQRMALEAWKANGFRGVAALPTGAGKSYLAVMAIAKLQRPALVVAPTLDLVEQWRRLLADFFGCNIGVLAGGEKLLLPLTVATYDSAVLRMEFIGNRFALLVCDECHHLPGPVYRAAAEQAVAPYRLGLSATPECESPERFELLKYLLGPVVAEVQVSELEGKVLSPYQVVSVPVALSPDERAEYDRSRAVYRDFVRRCRVDFAAADGWKKFLIACSRSAEGRAAFDAYLRQKEIACRGESKIGAVWEILCKHRGERILIFTADNATAYRLGREFVLPVLTCRTRPAERRDMLQKFRDSRYPVLVTSKVLNEGVDVPEAAVGIVVSGSGSVREHVQRLGRILRAAPGKRAVLYELVSADTAEESTSRRRREHAAYAGKVL